MRKGEIIMGIITFQDLLEKSEALGFLDPETDIDPYREFDEVRLQRDDSIVDDKFFLTFFNLPHLARFSVEDGNARFSVKDGVLFNKEGTMLELYPFSNGRDEYQVPEGTERIRIVEAKFLRNLIIGDTVEKIIVSDCPLLETVTIGKKVGFFGRSIDVFSLCPSLKSINVDKRNQNLFSEGGALYSRDKSTILRYPPSKDTPEHYVTPPWVTTIDNFAFSEISCTTFTYGPNVISLPAYDFVGAKINYEFKQPLIDIKEKAHIKKIRLFTKVKMIPTSLLQQLPDVVIEVLDDDSP